LEFLKRFEEVYWADTRYAMITRMTHEDWYAAVSAIKLGTHVPEEVRSEFDIARMTCIYAWNFYPLHQVAEMKVYSVVERGLRQIYPDIKWFGDVIRKAGEDGLLKPEQFESVRVDEAASSDYVEIMAKYLPKLRNSLAHGEPNIGATALFTLKNCSEIINQVYEPKA
jgi:hypothetical protein